MMLDKEIRYSGWPVKDEKKEIYLGAGMAEDITERRRSEQSASRIKNIFDRSMNEVYAFDDATLKILEVTRGAKENLGYAVDEFKQMTFPDIAPEFTTGLFYERITSLRNREKDVITISTVLKRKNGSVYPAEIHLQLIDRDSSPLFVAFASDISARIRQEKQLIENERRYKSLYEDSHCVMVLIDPETGELVDVNSSACTFYGYSREAMLKLKIYDINTLSMGEVKAKMQQAKSEGRTHYIFDHRLSDGTIKKVEVYCAEIEIRERKLLYSIVHDITSRVKAEKALSESEEKYHSMMAAMDDLVYICSADYRIEYMNPAMIRRTGYDATGKFCHKVLHDKDRMCPWCVNDIIQQGKSSGGSIKSPKDDRYYHVSNVPIRRPDGSISKMAIYRDITEIKQVEKEKKRLESQLFQAQKMRSIGALAGGIAHDFNNILFPITGYTEMTIGDLPEDSNLKDNLIEVLKAANRAKELVHQILAFSRQDDSEKGLLKIQLIVKEVLKLLRASIPANIEFKQQIDKSCDPIIANPTQMHQVVMNLCTNAYHAMEETGGCMTLSLKEVDMDSDDRTFLSGLIPGPHVLLSVSDTGHGMDHAVMKHVFEPYFTTKEQGGGTGLGLSTVHGIVKSCGGDIRVFSEPGKGSTFDVYLPRVENNGVKPETVSTQQIPKGSERILLVDDESQLVQMEKKMLEGLGYDVRERVCSLEALETFRASPDKFDLVISDMDMPNMTGVELSRELMKIRPDIPVIICTGSSRLISDEKAKKLGIKGYIMKPVLKNDMARVIRQALN